MRLDTRAGKFNQRAEIFSVREVGRSTPCAPGLAHSGNGAHGVTHATCSETIVIGARASARFNFRKPLGSCKQKDILTLKRRECRAPGLLSLSKSIGQFLFLRIAGAARSVIRPPSSGSCPDFASECPESHNFSF